MPNRDPRVDAYIAKARPFAKPILTYLRTVVHKGCPDVVEEIKWSSPHFSYKGMFCGIAAFKAHCIFGFWRHQVLVERGLIGEDDKALGQFGRITSLDDLPNEKTLVAIVRAAAALNDDGVRVPRIRNPPKPPVKTPAYLTAALKKNKKALATYQDFTTSNKREYVEWLTEAKSDDTRARRLATAIGWMAEGKIRNWKYMPKSK